MTRLSFLLVFTCISLFTSAQKYYLFIGTYTNTGSKGIYVYNFDATNGNVQWISNTDSANNPSYLTVSKNGNYVYAVNETSGANPGRVSAYSFNKKNGKLHFLNTQFSGGEAPCYVATSMDGKWLTVANYSSGSATAFRINKNGSLQPYAQLIQDTGGSINKARQESAHVHETVFSPDNGYLLTPDLGTDKIMIYKFNPSAKKPLIPFNPAYISVTPGYGPRHITFHPNKKFAYLIGELSGKVNVYKYNNGNFLEIQSISAHPESFKGTIGSAEVYVSPDGKFLYASNRGDENTITIFLINTVTGKLKLRGYQPTLGKAPRHFMIDPSGNYLLVANQDSDNIVIFKRDKSTGLLTATGKQIRIPKPVCLQLLPVN
ncbi:MAG: lactonase family protein [Bacteroidota bacterium]|nr:lactonase family protein [Bacteroidota bacterium]